MGSTSPRTLWAPALSTSKSIPASGPASHTNQQAPTPEPTKPQLPPPVNGYHPQDHHSPESDRAGPSPPTSRAMPAPGPAGPQCHPPAIQHQFWDTWAQQPENPGPGSASQWASTSPRAQFHPLVSGHQPWDHPDPNPTHQQVDTGPGTNTAPQPALSGPSQHTSRLAPVPGLPKPQPCPPAGQLLLWDTLDPSACCPEIQPHPPAS